jgi:hypothetical protein
VRWVCPGENANIKGIELFDNWAFDEVIGQSKLDTKTRVMMILASTIASQALGEYKVMVIFSPPLLHQFRSVSSARSCDRFYHARLG